MVYLKYVRGKDVQERLDNSELAGFAIPQALKQRPQEIDRAEPRLNRSSRHIA